MRLLSPPVPAAFTEPDNSSHLISHMPMLGSILFAVTRVEVVHIFSFYGMVSRTPSSKWFSVVLTFHYSELIFVSSADVAVLFSFAFVAMLFSFALLSCACSLLAC